MGAQKGKDLLLKMFDGASYVTIAGLRSRKIAFNAEVVDVTHAESVDRWRELLAGAGVKRASLSGRGLFKDAASDPLARQRSSTAPSTRAASSCRISARSTARSRSPASNSPANIMARSRSTSRWSRRGR